MPADRMRTQAITQGAETSSGRLCSDGDPESVYHRSILWTGRRRPTVPGRIVTGP